MGLFPSPGPEDTHDLCMDPRRRQGCSDGIGDSRVLALQMGRMAPHQPWKGDVTPGRGGPGTTKGLLSPFRA